MIIGAVRLNHLCVKSEHERLLQGELFGLPFLIPFTEKYEEIQGNKLMISSSCHHALIKTKQKNHQVEGKNYTALLNRLSVHARTNAHIAY